MATAFRWLLRLFTALVVLAALSVALVYFFAARSLPDYNADYRVAGLKERVEIVRDNANVPHILARNDVDAFYGLGLVHAQDRLWQMTMLRRRAQGRLSEVFGASTLPSDELVRRLDLHRLAIRSVAAMDEESREMLEAYARGVNAWIDIVNRDAMGRGAPEFFIFSNAIAPWQPADSVAIGKLLAFTSSNQLQSEVLRAQLSLRLSEERLKDLLPEPPNGALAALPGYSSADNAPVAMPRRRVARAGGEAAPRPVPAAMPLALGAPRAFAGASNAWAAAPDRSATGATLLANDPHYPLSAPSLFYLARLELRSGGVIGGTVPGMPQVMVGRSANLGWGLTAAFADDQDLYVEKLNPANPQEYETPDGYSRFRTERAVIRVKDSAPLTITLRWTQNGPVLPGSRFELASVTPPKHVVSLAWTGLSPEDTTLAGFRELMAAQDIETALEAGAKFVAPAYNLVLADRDGIAMQTVGALPARDPEHQSQGRLPAPGWVAANRWDGTLDYAENPRFVGPEGGIVGNTNNKMVDRAFPLHVGADWGDMLRIERWRKLMQGREVHTRESFIEAQLDTVSVAARNVLPLIARDLWFSGTAPEAGTPERKRQTALEMLANWNGEMNEHLPEPLIYAAWVRRLQELLIRDELGELAPRMTHVDPIFLERVFRNIEGAAAWCDVRQSAAKESCTDIARAALDGAIVTLEERYGQGLESLRWGNAHQARHDHEVLGHIPVLSWVVNIRQSTSGGDHTLRRGLTAGTGTAPYANVHAAGYRGVYDFADPDSSVFVTATGQSGHPLSRYYDDLGELWRRGEYIPMSLDTELAAAAAVGLTVLQPIEQRLGR